MAKHEVRMNRKGNTGGGKYSSLGHVILKCSKTYFPGLDLGIKSGGPLEVLGKKFRDIFANQNIIHVQIEAHAVSEGKEIFRLEEYVPHLFPQAVFDDMCSFMEKHHVLNPNLYVDESSICIFLATLMKVETIKSLVDLRFVSIPKKVEDGTKAGSWDNIVLKENYDDAYKGLCALGLESILPKTISEPYSLWFERARANIFVALVLVQELGDKPKEILAEPLEILKKNLREPVMAIGPTVFAYVYGLCLIYFATLCLPFVPSAAIFLAKFRKMSFMQSLILPFTFCIERFKNRDGKMVCLLNQLEKIPTPLAQNTHAELLQWHSQPRDMFLQDATAFDTRLNALQAIYDQLCEIGTKKNACQELLKNVNSIPEDKKQQFLKRFDALTETQQNNALKRFSFFAKNDPYIKMEFTTYRSWSTDINDCYPKVQSGGKMSEGNSQRLKALFEEWQQHASIIQDATKIGCLRLIEPLLETPGCLKEAKKALEEEREKYQIKTLLPTLITRFEQLRATKQRDHASWLQSARRIQNGKAERPSREFRKLEHDLAELEALA